MRTSLVRAARQAQTSNLSTGHLNISTLRAQSQRLRPIPRPSTSLSAQWISSSLSRRLYSTEQAPPSSKSEAAKEEGKTDISPLEAESNQDPVKKELEAAKKEILDLKDKYLRNLADMRNLEERKSREMVSAREFAISKFARDLLDSVDNIDRALSIVPDAVVKASEVEGGKGNDVVHKDTLTLYNGLKQIERAMLSTLSKNGLEPFNPAEKGEQFDPKVHEAEFMAPMPDKEDGSVLTTILKGYTLNGRVVRAAKVGVVKNS